MNLIQVLGITLHQKVGILEQQQNRELQEMEGIRAPSIFPQRRLWFSLSCTMQLHRPSPSCTMNVSLCFMPTASLVIQWIECARIKKRKEKKTRPTIFKRIERAELSTALAARIKHMPPSGVWPKDISDEKLDIQQWLMNITVSSFHRLVLVTSQRFRLRVGAKQYGPIWALLLCQGPWLTDFD